MAAITCFKAYDIRGRIPDQLNEDVTYRIARAYASWLKPSRIVVGYDIRLSSKALSEALIRGLKDSGVDVINIGQCGTEEVYFATVHLKVDGGIVVTASHNPKDYNGMKMVRQGSIPVSGDTGLKEIQALAEADDFSQPTIIGTESYLNTRPAYIQHLLGYVDAKKIPAFKIVCNAGNGGAGTVIDELEKELPIKFVKLHHEPDGNFPHGVPNPLLEENRQATIDAIVAEQADLGIAWDGDFDRCFFFDETGRFIEGYYLVGLLAQAFLEVVPGSKIIHDPRLVWNTVAIAEAFAGIAVQCKTGHAFIKERMRLEDAIYGGEMSAHHYFRDFFYCDSGMIPWLLVVGIMSRTGKPLSELVNARMAAFPASGEINREIADPAALLLLVEKKYRDVATEVDFTDGLSMCFANWRFNLRMSNTEPVVRLNVESRGDAALLQTRTQELLALMTN